MNRLEMFSLEVEEFLVAIGVNESADLSLLPSDDRQQNIQVNVRGTRWSFQQEYEEQDLSFGNFSIPDVEISIQYIDYLYRPPRDEDIDRIARSDDFFTKYRSLKEMVPYVRTNLDAIVALISSDAVRQSAAQMREIRKRAFDAIKPKRS